jgi:hypothetical protein
MQVCPNCSVPITAQMIVCTNCGVRFKTLNSTTAYSHSPNVNYYQRPYSTEEKPRANILVVVALILITGLLSALGYYMIATDPDNVSKKVTGVILISFSILFNLFIIFS